MKIRFKRSRISGQSIVEIIIALAIFLIIAGSGVVTVLGALSASRLGEEETKAALLASEGIEAVTSIKNQNWESLSAGVYGLSNSGGTWAFNGASDTDPSGKYTRVVNVDPVERQPNGEIILTGGVVDPDTYFVTSAVSWDFTPARHNSVSYKTYLTNWGVGTGVAGGGTITPIPSATLTPTPEATSTPTVTQAPVNTPTVTPAINSCTLYCSSISYSAGTCRKKVPDCSANGEIYESGGDLWCTGGNTKCCCAP